MSGLRWLIVMLFLLMLSIPGHADTISGMVVEIVGQRVTIINEKGEETTLTIVDVGSLQVGDEVRIEFSKVGDALLASDVQQIQP